MKCIKCGRETDQTFCEKCRAEMEKYPVKPGTIVLLPKERPANKKPQPRRQATPPEEKLRSQRRTIRRLSRAVAVLLVLLVLTGIAIVQLVERSAKPAVGQNYSTVTKPSGESTLPSDTQETAAQAPDTLAEEAVIAPAELEDYLFAQEESEEAAQRQTTPEEETATEEEIVPRET